MNLEPGRALLRGPLVVAHAGIDEMVQGCRAAGATTEIVRFAPPAGGDADAVAKLDRLLSAPIAPRVDEANRTALAPVLASRPHLVGVGIARDVVPGMAPDLFLHAGPPVTWERMAGPMRGAVVGGMLLEGLAHTPEEAQALAAQGRVRFDPCHHHRTVGPMAGLVTPSMPVWIVEDRGGGAEGKRTYCTLNEGLGKVLRFGAFGEEVIRRLRFMAETVAPVLAETLAVRGPVDLGHLMAQALQMGDEGHNRNRAGTSLLFRELAPAMARTGRPSDQIAEVLSFLHANDHTFLNLTMPMAKCMTSAAEGIPFSSMLTVMARNGTDFGIQLASMPGRWFTGPAQLVRGLYFPGYGDGDANPDLGDSAITETAGLGAFSMAAAPAIVQFVGGTAQDALATSRRMGRITLGRNPGFAIPSLGFQGAPTGIDLRRVLELNLLPTINTGIAHRSAGVGQVGAGLVSPPAECFTNALSAFAEYCDHALREQPEK